MDSPTPTPTPLWDSDLSVEPRISGYSNVEPQHYPFLFFNFETVSTKLPMLALNPICSQDRPRTHDPFAPAS